MKLIKRLFVLLFLLSASTAFAEPVEGRDYKLLSPPQPTRSGAKIEVIEFFFYGCSHCYRLNPFVSAWEHKLPKDVQFTYVPAVFNPVWEISAKTFYALETMGLRAKMHDTLFNAWNANIELVDEASTADFLAKQGVDRKKFSEAFNAFSTQSSVMRAKQMGMAYGIRGTPTLIIDGKYTLQGDTAETVETLKFLVDKARKERGGKKK